VTRARREHGAGTARARRGHVPENSARSELRCWAASAPKTLALRGDAIGECGHAFGDQFEIVVEGGNVERAVEG